MWRDLLAVQWCPLHAVLLRWLLALVLGLMYNSLMPDLSPPNARGVLLVLGRAWCVLGAVPALLRQ